MLLRIDKFFLKNNYDNIKKIQKKTLNMAQFSAY
jgi:hypothetical protein